MTDTILIMTFGSAMVSLRTLLGPRHPLSLVPGPFACAVGYGDAPSTGWQVTWVVMGVGFIAMITWLTVERLRGSSRRAGAEPDDALAP